MPWKMILFLILLVIIGVFATFNLENRSDISLGVVEFEGVPVFLSLVLAFVLGALVMIPFLYSSRRQMRKKVDEPQRGHREPRDADFPGQAPEPNRVRDRDPNDWKP